MSDPCVDRWTQHGTVALWQDPRDRLHEDWNMTADDAACDALLDLHETNGTRSVAEQEGVVAMQTRRNCKSAGCTWSALGRTPRP